MRTIRMNWWSCRKKEGLWNKSMYTLKPGDAENPEIQSTVLCCCAHTGDLRRDSRGPEPSGTNPRRTQPPTKVHACEKGEKHRDAGTRKRFSKEQRRLEELHDYNRLLVSNPKLRAIAEPVSEAHRLLRDRGDCHRELEMTTKDKRRRESPIFGLTAFHLHQNAILSSVLSLPLYRQDPWKTVIF